MRITRNNLLGRPSGMSAGSETGDLRPLLRDQRSTSDGQSAPERLSTAGQTNVDSADAKVCIKSYVE